VKRGMASLKTLVRQGPQGGAWVSNLIIVVLSVN
jgi:hypothetical protein